MEITRQYDPKEVEGKIYKRWLKERLFSAKKNFRKQPFSIVIPPPNITGILHMGHALNNTIQDTLIRFKRMQGYESLWMPGTDHAGIATQNVVEKELAKDNLKKEDLGREDFLKKLWSWKEKYGSTIIEQLKKLGASCDWERMRFTMDEGYSKAVAKVFVSLWKQGLIYQGDYIINWCPRCQTALSDEEAPYREKEGFLYQIKYPLKGTNGFLVVATTRPETMLGDTAVAVNPKDRRYAKFSGKRIALPLVGREIRVISDSFVDPEFGTGAVKVTPAHDPNDFEIAKRHHLPWILVMNPDGTMNENAGEFAKMDRFKAREAVIAALKSRNLLNKIEPHLHTLGHCYRCNTIVEPYLSRQWFVKMRPLAKPAITAVKKGKILFYPQRWAKVYLNWVENIRDWCISRQIWWGHRLPVYYCKKCTGETGSKIKNRSTKIQKFQKKGIIVSSAKPKKCPRCGGGSLVQDEDVLDTWFSSWLWPFAVFGWPFDKAKGQRPKTKDLESQGRTVKDLKAELKYFYPTDILVTAPEIIFFWVARMIIAGFKFRKAKPFGGVYIHGTVRDATGKKMSKSLGNIIDPIEVIDKVGADSLRFSLILQAGSGSDLYLSDENFLAGRNFCNKIWNASRFVILKTKENNLRLNNLNLEKVDPLDRWILKKLNETIEGVTKSLDEYRINEAAKTAYEFFWHTFCDWYIEISKYNFSPGKAKVLIYLLVNSLKLLHPFTPFITEEIFQLIKSNFSLPFEEYMITSLWPKKFRLEINRGENKMVEALIKTIKAVRQVKADLGIAAQKTKLQFKTTAARILFLEANRSWIERLTLAKGLELRNADKGEGLERVLYDSGLWELNLEVEGAELWNLLPSLDRKIRKFKELLARSQARLANKKFIDNAPGQKVKEEESKSKDFLIEINRLERLRNVLR